MKVATEQGMPQGGNLSPEICNVFLHYVLDVWFEKTIRPQVEGRAYLVGYADDFVCMVRTVGEAYEIEALAYGTVHGVRSGIASGKDAGLKLRPIREGEGADTEASRKHVRFSGIHALLRHEPEGQVHGQPDNQPQEVPAEMQGHECVVEGGKEYRPGQRLVADPGSQTARTLSVLWDQRQHARASRGITPPPCRLAASGSIGALRAASTTGGVSRST